MSTTAHSLDHPSPKSGLSADWLALFAALALAALVGTGLIGRVPW
jgi:hypothetical protein